MLLCRHNNLGTVKMMYADEANIIVIPESEESLALDKIKESAGDVLRLGYLSDDADFNAVDYDQKFYAQAGVPFSNRWGRFSFPGMTECEGWNEALVVHDDARFPIVRELPQRPTIRIRPDTDSLIHWWPIILGAVEIHCIPSSVFLLIDSVTRPDVPLFLHSYSRTDITMPTIKRPWTILQ